MSWRSLKDVTADALDDSSRTSTSEEVGGGVSAYESLEKKAGALAKTLQKKSISQEKKSSVIKKKSLRERTPR